MSGHRGRGRKGRARGLIVGGDDGGRVVSVVGVEGKFVVEVQMVHHAAVGTLYPKLTAPRHVTALNESRFRGRVAALCDERHRKRLNQQFAIHEAVAYIGDSITILHYLMLCRVVHQSQPVRSTTIFIHCDGALARRFVL